MFERFFLKSCGFVYKRGRKKWPVSSSIRLIELAGFEADKEMKKEKRKKDQASVKCTVIDSDLRSKGESFIFIFSHTGGLGQTSECTIRVIEFSSANLEPGILWFSQNVALLEYFSHDLMHGIGKVSLCYALRLIRISVCLSIPGKLIFPAGRTKQTNKIL